MFTNLSDRMKIALQAVLILAIVGTAIAILISAGVMQTRSESHLLTFEVRSAGGFAVITLDAGSEKMSKPQTVSVPWSQTMGVSSGTEVYSTASNPRASGEISCKITLDKVLWKKAQNTAPKNGVACAGIVP